MRLGVEQAADVLRDLRDVLDDEQANLVTADAIGATIPRGPMHPALAAPSPACVR